MSQKTILVVEDELFLLEITTSILQLYGFATLSATNALEGLAVVEQTIPDLIISDVMMGEIDGFQFVKMLKENSLFQDIPVIFLTALADVVDKNKGMAVGAQAYITKPFNGKELANTINQLLQPK